MNDYNTYSDEELLPILREEKPARDYAFDCLYKRYAHKLNSYCMFLCRNKSESENLYHRTWIKFYEYVKNGNHINTVLTFLIITSRNIFLNDIKSKDREKRKIDEYSLLTEMENSFHHFRSNTDKSDLISLIHLAVDSLDEIYKEPFVLKRYYEMPNEEIAKICDVSIECVRKRITRATLKVKEICFQYSKENQNKNN